MTTSTMRAAVNNKIKNQRKAVKRVIALCSSGSEHLRASTTSSGGYKLVDMNSDTCLKCATKALSVSAGSPTSLTRNFKNLTFDSIKCINRCAVNEICKHRLDTVDEKKS